ncbi:MAG: hypothetical protein DI568_10460 [Sphingomonas sp.]|nr:MAG: hypothetical protein DI568_10460 [Sphingomonas sp.]
MNLTQARVFYTIVMKVQIEMTLTGEVRIGATPDMVWAALTDPERISQWGNGQIDNLQTLQPAGEGRLRGVWAADVESAGFDLTLNDSPDGGTLLGFSADGPGMADEDGGDARLQRLLQAVKSTVEHEVQAAVPGLPGWLWIGGLVLLVLVSVAWLLN